MSAVATDTPANTQVATGAWYRNYLWLIKRELWEHKRFFYAPLVVSAIALFSVIYGVFQMDGSQLVVDGNGIRLSSKGGDGTIGNIGGFHLATFVAFCAPFFIVTFFVTAHYTMDTLFADRKDRSILFWKSLPVSDIETVFSKLIVAAVVAPLVTLVIALATQLIVYLVVTVGLASHGHDTGLLWRNVPIFQSVLMLLYSLAVTALWYLPVWSWFLLASAWASRAVFLWAVLPFAGAAFLEYQMFGTHYTGRFVEIRLTGMVDAAGNITKQTLDAVKSGAQGAINVSDIITPGAYLANPQLWIGFALAAALLTATVWARRYRDSA